MSASPTTPNPRITVWTILGLVLIIVVLVGWLALPDSTFVTSSTGGMGRSFPAVFLLIAVIVGLACVAHFVHRGHEK